MATFTLTSAPGSAGDTLELGTNTQAGGLLVRSLAADGSVVQAWTIGEDDVEQLVAFLQHSSALRRALARRGGKKQ